MYRKFFLIALFFCISLPAHLFANISRTFNDSLPFIASGNYTWSIWDYLTNPYIYQLQKEDAISAIITNPADLTQGDYLIASRFSILDFPIFLSFGVNNPSGRVLEVENPLEATITFQEIQEEKIRVLLGTHFGPKLGNLGIGVFAFHYTSFSETFDRNSVRIFRNYLNATSGRDRIPSKFGIELGQKLPGRVNPAWTISLEYRMWRGREEDINEASADSPRTLLIESPFIRAEANDYNDQPAFRSQQGYVRDEVAARFLGWWPIPLGDSADVGLDINFYIPFGSGKTTQSVNNARIIPGSENGTTYGDEGNYTDDFINDFYPLITLSGYGVDSTFFYDQDFTLFNSSTIRFSPMLRYKRFQESLVEGSLAIDPTFPSGDTVSLFEETLSFGIAFKLALNLTRSKKFTVYFGWLPSINLYDKRVYITDIETNKRTTTNYVSALKAGLAGSYFTGLTYHFSKSLHLHFRWLGDTSNRGKLDISAFDLGLDFIFNTQDAEYSG